MSQTLTILLAIALGLTLLVLFAGIISMARGGEFNRKHGNRLMRLRVAVQGAAILILVLVLYLFRGG